VCLTKPCRPPTAGTLAPNVAWACRRNPELRVAVESLTAVLSPSMRYAVALTGLVCVLCGSVAAASALPPDVQRQLRSHLELGDHAAVGVVEAENRSAAGNERESRWAATAVRAGRSALAEAVQAGGGPVRSPPDVPARPGEAFGSILQIWATEEEELANLRRDDSGLRTPTPVDSLTLQRGDYRPLPGSRVSTRLSALATLDGWILGAASTVYASALGAANIEVRPAADGRLAIVWLAEDGKYQAVFDSRRGVFTEVRVDRGPTDQVDGRVLWALYQNAAGGRRERDVTQRLILRYTAFTDIRGVSVPTVGTLTRETVIDGKLNERLVLSLRREVYPVAELPGVDLWSKRHILKGTPVVVSERKGESSPIDYVWDGGKVVPYSPAIAGGGPSVPVSYGQMRARTALGSWRPYAIGIVAALVTLSAVTIAWMRRRRRLPRG